MTIVPDPVPAEARQRPIIRVETLGVCRVVIGGVRVEALDTRGILLAVLVYLAVERERSREQILGMFWPERDPERARRSLNQALYELRQVLGEHWLVPAGESLRVNGFLECDMLSLERAAQASARGELLKIFQGSFLDGFAAGGPAFEQWASGKRALSDRLARSAIRDELAACLGEGSLGGALAAARRWVRMDPFDDEAQHRLIHLLAAQGDRSGSVRQFELYQGILAEDDLTPLAETLALIESIRRAAVPAVPGFQGPETNVERAEAPKQERSSPPRSETRRWLAGPGPSGPRLTRIRSDGTEAEVWALNRGETVLGRSDGTLTFPHDSSMKARHAVIVGPETEDAPLQYILRPAEEGAAIFLRLHSPWPLRGGDLFIAGSSEFRLLE